jgi:hypothetical protein
MGDPRNTSYENSNLDFDSPHFFSEFPRIQVAPLRNNRDEDFKSLSTRERQEVLERLIDRVNDL